MPGEKVLEMIIALTDTFSRGFEHNPRWLQSGGSEVSCRKVSSALSNLDELDRSDGVLLTGGGDVDPTLYGREDAGSIVEGVDKGRDRFERLVIERALQRQLPLLCICRGMQLFNVTMGGTLIPDLVTAGNQEHRKGKTGDRIHEVTVEGNSILSNAVEIKTGVTNSSHHQAVDRPGKGLRATVRSIDGVIEAMEWGDAGGKPFLQMVQWHPERMKDRTNPFSQNLLHAFLQAVKYYESNKQSSRSTMTMKPTE